MKKPKWRKYRSGYRRGVLAVHQCSVPGEWSVYAAERWRCYCPTPEAAMKAADKWWEKMRIRMEGK